MPRTLSEDEISEFRERLCAAAARLHVEHGAEAVTMRRLAAELGCSAMTPYRYFKDKDEILAAVRTAAFERLADVMEAAMGGPGTALERAAAVNAAYTRFAFERPHEYRLMFDTSVPSPKDYPELRRAAARAQNLRSASMNELVAAGELEGDVFELSVAFWAAHHGVIMLEMAGMLTQSMPFERVQAVLRHTLSRGAKSNT